LFGDDERLQEETSFIGSGIVDSTGIMELVAFLEERFEVRVEDEEVVPENLDSLKNVTAYLERKLNGG
jgi:acyl carrier protein